MPDVAELAAALRQHQSQHPEREAVVARMLELLGRGSSSFLRSAWEPGHFTASAFVLCPARRRLIMIYHRRLAAWLQPGGHIEAGDVSLAAAARREVAEETGLVDLLPLGTGVLDVDAHAIPPTPKEGAHEHFDVRYAFVAREERLSASDEVGGIRWVELGEVPRLNPEASLARALARLSARIETGTAGDY